MTAGSVAPDAPAEAARRHNPLLRTAGRLALRLFGWRVTGQVPAAPRFVAIVAPHTSNWDFVVGVFVMFALDLRIVWLGKESLFAIPLLGTLLRALGGRPVRRDAREGVVRHVAEMLRGEPRFILALAPEGTRKRVREWRTGFYRIAESAGVPIVPVWLDWKRREAGIGAPTRATGALARDVAILKRLYRPEMARYPANYGVASGIARAGG